MGVKVTWLELRRNLLTLVGYESTGCSCAMVRWA